MKQVYSRRMILNKIAQYSALAEDAEALLLCLRVMKNTTNEFEFAVYQEKAEKLETELLRFARRLVQMYSPEQIVLQSELEDETI